MLSKRKQRLTKQISQLRNAIKRKYEQIKYGSIASEQELSRQYKPILEELRKQNGRVDKDVKLEHKVKEEKLSYSESDEEEGNSTFGLPHYTSSPNKTIKSSDISTTLSSEDGRNTASRFVESTFTHPLTREYMTKMFTDIEGRNSSIDHIYGPRYENDMLMIGNKQLQFTPDGDIYVDSTKFKPTHGLYELIFNRVPDRKVYNDSDLRAYKSILLKTDAHKKNYDTNERVNRNTTTKYRNIIKDLFPTTYVGSGYKSSFKRDISYWDDPNELCDRLRLLEASTQSGNSGHTNEIINITEELKEAGFIKGRGNSRYRSLVK